MRKTRFIKNCRCYHLISRLAHQAFFLDDDEKTRRGYAFMYGNGDWEMIRACHEKSMREAMSEILAAREADRAEGEAKGEPAPSRRTDPLPSKADSGLAMPRKHGVELERGRPEIVERILKLLESGPLWSSAIRKAVGICSGIHLSRYYLTPMMAKGLIKRTDPDHPQSPQQRYRLA